MNDEDRALMLRVARAAAMAADTAYTDACTVTMTVDQQRELLRTAAQQADAASHAFLAIRMAT